VMGESGRAEECGCGERWNDGGQMSHIGTPSGNG
jgi:hypothetical protein